MKKHSFQKIPRLLKITFLSLITTIFLVSTQVEVTTAQPESLPQSDSGNFESSVPARCGSYNSETLPVELLRISNNFQEDIAQDSIELLRVEVGISNQSESAEGSEVSLRNLEREKLEQENLFNLKYQGVAAAFRNKAADKVTLSEIQDVIASGRISGSYLQFVVQLSTIKANLDRLNDEINSSNDLIENFRQLEEAKKTLEENIENNQQCLRSIEQVIVSKFNSLERSNQSYIAILFDL